jgi:hypothetical protein
MNSQETVLHSRRSILGMALGIFATGCASVANTSGVGPRAGGGGFPSPRAWCWDRSWTSTNATKLDLFGQLIMQGRNPYCVINTSPSACDPSNSDTWPQQLTDEDTWKILTEFDFQSTYDAWDFGAPGNKVHPSRSMRIPYLIKQAKAKKKPGTPGPPPSASLGRENILVGYEENNNAFAGAAEWNGPAACSGSTEPVGLLAQFIVINMMRVSDSASFYMPNWNVLGSAWPNLEDGGQTKSWYFRRSQIVVDYAFRVPIATGVKTAAGATAQKAGWIYVGYEGGGSY